MTPTTTPNLSSEVYRICGESPCLAARAWLTTQTSLVSALAACERGDWIAWAAAHLSIRASGLGGRHHQALWAALEEIGSPTVAYSYAYADAYADADADAMGVAYVARISYVARIAGGFVASVADAAAFDARRPREQVDDDSIYRRMDAARTSSLIASARILRDRLDWTVLLAGGRTDTVTVTVASARAGAARTSLAAAYEGYRSAVAALDEAGTAAFAAEHAYSVAYVACARARRSLDEAEDSVVAADEELARERAEEDQP